MTADEFRETPSLRDGLFGLLRDPALSTALSIVKSRNETVPLPFGSSGIDAASMCTERQTRAIFVAELQELATAIPGLPTPTPAENYGTENTVDDFDNPNPPNPPTTQP